jgi:bifunctional non-homologous end joining protein LigD
MKSHQIIIKKIGYLCAMTNQALLYMVNLGCISFVLGTLLLQQSINQFGWWYWSTIDDFDNVIKVALLVKVMDELDTSCYCKTSGATVYMFIFA